jgi:hypothetical protein
MRWLRLVFEKSIQEDKKQHFLVCFILMLGFLPYMSIIYSVIITLAIGFLKEIWDIYFGTGFCWFDMSANILGILGALGYSKLIGFILSIGFGV